LDWGLFADQWRTLYQGAITYSRGGTLGPGLWLVLAVYTGEARGVVESDGTYPVQCGEAYVKLPEPITPEMPTARRNADECPD
jgi:hypothetical protein